MSENHHPAAPDVTAVRRNPGLGHISARQCIRCGSRTVSQEGWGSIFYAGRKRMCCPKCVAEKAAMKARKA